MDKQKGGSGNESAPAPCGNRDMGGTFQRCMDASGTLPANSAAVETSEIKVSPAQTLIERARRILEQPREWWAEADLDPGFPQDLSRVLSRLERAEQAEQAARDAFDLARAPDWVDGPHTAEEVRRARASWGAVLNGIAVIEQDLDQAVAEIDQFRSKSPAHRQPPITGTPAPVPVIAGRSVSRPRERRDGARRRSSSSADSPGDTDDPEPGERRALSPARARGPPPLPLIEGGGNRLPAAKHSEPDTASAPAIRPGRRRTAMSLQSMTDTPAVQWMIARGWRLLPIRPQGKAPLTRHGVKDASDDPEVIAGWLARWPDANLAVACGSPGPAVLGHRRPDCGSGGLGRVLRQAPMVATRRGSHSLLRRDRRRDGGGRLRRAARAWQLRGVPALGGGRARVRVAVDAARAAARRASAAGGRRQAGRCRDA